MTGYEAIAKLNVLSSYDTEKEKREEYKKCINAIIKDLEELQELKNIMGTPIQDIMKKLKDLQELKTFINNYLQFQLVYDDIDHYEIIPVKQYLGNSGCLLLTEDRMKKILDICND